LKRPEIDGQASICSVDLTATKLVPATAVIATPGTAQPFVSKTEQIRHLPRKILPASVLTIMIVVRGRSETCVYSEMTTQATPMNRGAVDSVRGSVVDVWFGERLPPIFSFHNNRWLIHTLVHGSAKEDRFHVHGYMDRGTTTTPFDMVVLNDMSSFHLAIDALKNVPRLRSHASDVIDMFNRKLNEHHDYIRQHLEDMPEIRNWSWTADFCEPNAPQPLAKGHTRADLYTNS
jgi:hypothetical protein